MAASRKRDLLFFAEYIGLLLLALVWIQLGHVREHIGDRLGTVYLLDAIAITYVLFRAWLVVFRDVRGAWEYLYIAVDLSIITAFVHLTGGIHSDAGLAYLWPLSTATSSQSPTRTLAVSLAIGVLYAAATWASVDTPDYALRLALRLLLLVLVAALAYASTRAQTLHAREVVRLRQQVVLADFRTRLQHEMQEAMESRLEEIDAQLDDVAALARTRPREIDSALGRLKQSVAQAAGDLRAMVRKARGALEQQAG